MLFLRLLNAKIVFLVIAGAVLVAAGMTSRCSQAIRAVQRGTTQHLQNNAKGYHELQHHRMK